MDKRTVASAHERIDQIELQIVAMKTEMDIQFKDLFNRVKRLEAIMIGSSATVIVLLLRLITSGQAMLAELAAFNAAYATVKATVKAGRELTSAAVSISKMVENKDAMQQRLSRKKNSPFSMKVETELEEFLALEEMKQAEKDLELLMVYTGRPGLKDDWLKFQADARKMRKEAERQAIKEREELIEFLQMLGAICAAFVLVAAGIWYLGVYMGKW